jgi:hypothetical protein
LSESSSEEEIRAFHRQLLDTSDDFVCQTKNISGNAVPKFHKNDPTHLVWKEVRYLNVIENLLNRSSNKVIGVVRHPCGVINSWRKAPREFDEGWEIRKEWRRAQSKNSGPHEFYGFERWLNAARLFMEMEVRFPDRFKAIGYESLVRDPVRVSKLLFGFVGLEYSDQSQSFLIESTTTSSDDPYDVYRKNKIPQEWAMELPEDIIKSITSDERFAEIAGWLNSISAGMPVRTFKF